MEFVTLLLSGLIGLLSPTGLITESVAESTIRNSLDDAETLVVRVDATPSHQLLAGQVDRLRIAGRGLYPLDGIRIDTLDVETDAIDINFGALRNGTLELDEPLQAVIHLRLTLEDLNRALQSATVAENLRDLSLNALGEGAIAGLNRSDVVNASIAVPEPHRLRIQAHLQEQETGEELRLVLEFGLKLANGYQIEILSPRLIANGEEFPPDLLIALAEGISQELTLRNLESSGITARLLKLEIDDTGIQLVTFVRLDPSSELLSRE